MMGKCCCAVGCSNKIFKGCGLQFYRFPADTEKRNRWIAAVSRSNWQPTEYTWICSCHFVGGRKSNDPTSPAYIPTLFKHKTKTIKRKAECHLARHERAIKRKRLQALAGTDQQSKSTASNMTTLPDCSSLYNADHGQQSSSRQLSRLRIHVERVIGFLRLKYKILRSTLPINLIMCRDGDDHSTIDKIVTICSALCNCCESVVPFN